MREEPPARELTAREAKAVQQAKWVAQWRKNRRGKVAALSLEEPGEQQPRRTTPLSGCIIVERVNRGHAISAAALSRLHELVMIERAIERATC